MGYEAAWERPHEGGKAEPQRRQRFGPVDDGVIMRRVARELAEEGGH